MLLVILLYLTTRVLTQDHSDALAVHQATLDAFIEQTPSVRGVTLQELGVIGETVTRRFAVDHIAETGVIFPLDWSVDEQEAWESVIDDGLANGQILVNENWDVKTVLVSGNWVTILTSATTAVALNPDGSYAIGSVGEIYFMEIDDTEDGDLEDDCDGMGIGDPRFSGFGGGKFTFNGKAGSVFNIISTPHFQFNSRFVDAVYATTFLGTAGIQLGKDKIRVDINGTAYINTFPVSKNHTGDIHLKSGIVSVQYHDRHPHVAVKTLGFDLKLYWKKDFVPHLDVAVKYDDQPGLKPHGILGQTSDLIPRTITSPQGQGSIDGSWTDYIINDGLFGRKFKFNQFTGKDIVYESRPPRIPKKRVQLLQFEIQTYTGQHFVQYLNMFGDEKASMDLQIEVMTVGGCRGTFLSSYVCTATFPFTCEPQSTTPPLGEFCGCTLGAGCICADEPNHMECGRVQLDGRIVGRLGVQWFSTDLINYFVPLRAWVCSDGQGKGL